MNEHEKINYVEYPAKDMGATKRASAAKVLLFDLSNAMPLVRIGLLVILGVTLYVGGWMYRKVDLIDTKTVSSS